MDKLDILQNITNFENNLENIDEKINIIKSLGNDDFYKNLLNHNSKSLNKDCNRTEIIKKYINELYKGNDKTYEFQKKIEESIKLGDLQLGYDLKEVINIKNITTDYNFGNIQNIKLNDSISYIKENNKYEELLYFKDIFDEKILFEKFEIFKKIPYNRPENINDDSDKIDLLFYNLQQIINNKEKIICLYKQIITKEPLKGGNKFNINIENNLFMLKENIINVLDTYNYLSKYNQVVKIEDELNNDYEFYKYVIIYYYKLLSLFQNTYILNLLIMNGEKLKELRTLNNNKIQEILNKYNFEDSKIYLLLTNNLELAYLIGFYIFINKI
jgi:hypothetical protein